MEARAPSPVLYFVMEITDAPPEPRVSLTAAIRGWWRDGLARDGFLTTLRRFLCEFWDFILDSTPAGRRRRYGDIDYDWEHRVNTTSAAVGWRDRLLGVFHSPYQPTEPALFHDMLQALKIDFDQFTFVDLGSGKGRTLLMAADYPFRRVVGVELLPGLNRIARENISLYHGALQKCFALESICADAREFVFPDEPLVLYLFNPFLESGLARVIANLEQSLRTTPRPVAVLYHNPLLANVIEASPLFRKSSGTHQYTVYRTSIG